MQTFLFFEVIAKPLFRDADGASRLTYRHPLADLNDRGIKIGILSFLLTFSKGAFDVFGGGCNCVYLTHIIAFPQDIWYNTRMKDKSACRRASHCARPRLPLRGHTGTVPGVATDSDCATLLTADLDKLRIFTSCPAAYYTKNLFICGRFSHPIFFRIEISFCSTTFAVRNYPAVAFRRVCPRRPVPHRENQFSIARPSIRS